MDPLEKLTVMIEKGRLLSPEMFGGLDIDAALDQRDSPEFDEHWMNIYNKVEEESSAEPLGERELSRVERAAEVAYKTSFQNSESPELAGYISDDFDLIAKALLLSFNDSWLNSLLASYCDGRFPKGKLEPVPGQLSAVLATCPNTQPTRGQSKTRR